MTPGQLNIKIAQACGWTILPAPVLDCEFVSYAKDPNGCLCPGIPDYCNDLDAMHESIMQVIVHGESITQHRSNEDLFQTELDKISEREQVPVWHFTAALYAEALIKTLNI